VTPRRTLAISDIHGERQRFERLLDEVHYDPTADDNLILLGDYVDRGPDSRGVVELVIGLRDEGATVLMGNHEQMMLDAFAGEPGAIERWFNNGGQATLRSYGHRAATARRIPRTLRRTPRIVEHLEFLAELDYFHETDDAVFVHGGVDPDVELADLAETDPDTLLWIRDRFFRRYAGAKTVVFGHTATPFIHGSPDVYFGDNQVIGIDGGAVYGGPLHCLELPARRVHSVA
jgi:serine/threonine protein phosphatase 1